MNLNPDLKTLLDVGIHLGHPVKNTHPEMYPHVYGSRNGQAILNLDNTVVALRQTLAVMSNVQRNGGSILFANKQLDLAPINKKLALDTGHFYVNRWTNGLLTNWDVQRSYIDMFHQKVSSGTLGKGRKLRKIKKLRKSFDGIIEMDEKPDMIFLFHAKHSDNVIKEANRCNIPVIAVVDSDCNPTGIDYPIPGNDNSLEASYLIAQLIATALERQV